ncbi:hypothetical protein VTJ83DRAFT_3336 [Remersonia thermophila]|uniref:Grh/CP2 DB domain-containing protein n=1 Tax=Remersonia thermophila TaxID=72144 RepID=A0ABR4DDR0_9PEZI
MFRQRTSARKPVDDLVANFRQQFPEIVTAASSSSAVPVPTVTADQPSDQGNGPARSHSVGRETLKDHDETPRATNDAWRFTPSLLDAANFPLASFGSIPGILPTPGGTDTLYHPQAGFLHTPNLGFGMGFATPRSMSNSDGIVHPANETMELSAFNNYHPLQFQPFSHFMHNSDPSQNPSYAPVSLHDARHEAMDMDVDHSNGRLGSVDSSVRDPSPVLAARKSRASLCAALPLLPAGDGLRFQAILLAPTAMTKHADEIPVTYLNKGQIYSLTITDTSSRTSHPGSTRYRTFVRISFDDEQQREKPGACWSLWKEGRGTSEAHQRGGRLQAVEYVDIGPQQPTEDSGKQCLEIESESFDGFSVIWTPAPGGPAECVVCVRFNFLSTDFSHSKGVKGIPVRLCAKTQQLDANSTTLPPTSTGETSSAPEIAYCKVKLFRDHGAERKLANDMAHVKKSIDKLKQQIAQVESGVRDFGSKRKRSGAGSIQLQSGTGKAPKHKRTWSMSSASSAGGDPLAEDLYHKLKTLEDMFTSQRPASALFLRGSDLDDPDLHPVVLPGDAGAGKSEPIPWTNDRNSTANSSLISPSPSSLSLYSQVSNAITSERKGSWSDSFTAPSTQHRPPNHPAKVPEIDSSGTFTGRWIEALGVDSTYQPPPPGPAPKPVACFYVRRVPQRSLSSTSESPSSTSSFFSSSASSPNEGSQPRQQRDLHRAVYLTQRTARELIERLVKKWPDLNPGRVARLVRIVGQGCGGNGGPLDVEVDDDVVREMPEGVCVSLEVVPAYKKRHNQHDSRSRTDEGGPNVKHEWDMLMDVVQDNAPGEMDGELHHDENGVGSGMVELRLRY